MTATLESSYQPLQPFGPDAGDSDETPQESGLVYHIAPEPGRARWNHIEDLDSFFQRVYQYHQKHGFTSIVLQDILEFVQFIFVVAFTTFLANCVDYGVYFKQHPPPGMKDIPPKISLLDGIIPPKQCLARFNFVTYFVLIVAIGFAIAKMAIVMRHIIQFWDVQQFYNIALKIQDNELDNFTWHEVQKRVREVQREQQMCIHKQELTELDIYHRILRFKNYMVALMNKNILPVNINFPLIGPCAYFTRGLRFNIEFLLFYGPWAPFDTYWHLRDEYRKIHKRNEIASEFRNVILVFACLNAVLAPVILFWQLVYGFFSYAELVKREPGALGYRNWSQYGRLYFRHFNELDHELNARLSRAYRPAAKYMGCFTSPIVTIIAKNIAFISGAILGILIVLGIYDEDFFHVDYVLSIMTAIGCTVALARSMVPDENQVWCPETLLNAVLAQVHYLPNRWHGLAHTRAVRHEFSKFFHYRAESLLQELISPFLTPFILAFCVRSRAIDYVDFFRNFTVDVVGVGDICSFALMDVGKHGISPTRINSQPSTQNQQPFDETTLGINIDDHPNVETSNDVKNEEADETKIELSLIHFTFTNPEWRPPECSNSWIAAYRSQLNSLSPAQFDQLRYHISGVYHGSSTLDNSALNPLGAGGFGDISRNYEIWPDNTAPEQSPPIFRGLTRTEGPTRRSLLNSNIQDAPIRASLNDRNNEAAVDEMTLSTLYFYQLQQRENRNRPDIWSRAPTQPAFERTPLLTRPSMGP